MSSPILKLRRTIGRALRNARRPATEGRGHNFVRDVRERLPHRAMNTIFDVGANIGLTAIEFTDAWPKATLYAFEPGSDNWRRMAGNLTGKPDVRRFQIGFSDKRGAATLLVEPDHPTMARVLEGPSDEPTETIQLDTVDDFCREHDIAQIDFMKIDTEGHELGVLAGASGMLSRGAISLIKLESAIDPDSDYHTQLFDVCAVLHPHGYRLFGFYDQWEDTIQEGHPRLRRFDAAFISPRIGRR